MMEEQERMAEMLPEVIPVPDPVSEPAVQWYQNVTLEDAETFIGANLKSAARSVIAIGYYLKCIRDGGLYKECGYENIWDYAREKFGFSMSTASRYMTRNDKFSKGGNSPILDEKYREYNKSQLQEMLSLDAEQLEQVTPAMTVKEIRQLRKPAEIPYVEIPGQMSMEDFLDEGPAPEEEHPASMEEMLPIPAQTGSVTLRASDFVEPEEPEVIATSQQKTAGVPEVDENASCPPGVSSCERQQWGTSPEEQKEGRAECTKCWSRWKNTQKVLSAAEGQQEDENAAEMQRELLSAYGTRKRVYPEDSLIATEGCEGGHDCFLCSMDCQIRQAYRYCREAPCGNPFPCEQVPRQEAIISEGNECQFLNHFIAEHRAGDGEPEPCCKSCETPCEFICSRAKSEMEVQKRECEVDASNEPDTEEELLTDLQIAKEQLEKEQKLLCSGLNVVPDKSDIHIRRMKIRVAALANFVCELENIENPPPEPEQPELPLLKNNDQRKDWLDNYRNWGIWYEDEHIGAKYYKYDFEDGTRLIVDEYVSPNGIYGELISSYLHMVGGCPDRPKGSQGISKYAYHDRYSRYPDSMSEVVEFLKDYQRRIQHE